MPVATDVLRPVLEVVDERDQLADGLLVGTLPLLGGRELGLAEHPGLAVARGPGEHRGRPGGEAVDPVERAVLLVVGDRAVGDPVLAHVVGVEVHVDRRLELAGVRAAAREGALAPARQELRVDREQVRPLDRQALGVGLEVRAARDEIEVRPVRAVAVQQDDLLEPVVGERLRDVEHVMHEVLEVVVDRPGKVHHVARVAVGDRREHEHLAGDLATGAERDLGRAEDVDVERQVRPVLLDGAARDDADLPELDRVLDLRPRQLRVAILLGRAGHAGLPSSTWWRASRSRLASFRLRLGRDSRHDDVPVERLEQELLVALMQDVEKLSVLRDDGVEIALAAVAVEVGTDPRRDAAPDVDRVELRRDVEHRLVELDVGLHDPVDVACRRGLLHHPDVARELGEVGRRADLERRPEPELLQHEPDRDQDAVHLVLRDADHDGAAVRVRDHEPFVLQLAECLAGGAAGRLEPGHDPVLDEPLARLQATVDDRVPELDGDAIAREHALGRDQRRLAGHSPVTPPGTRRRPRSCARSHGARRRRRGRGRCR